MSDKLRRIGYIRTSLTGPHPNLQADALEQAACTELHEVDGQVNPREALKELLNLLGDGDSLLVHRLDRLGRDEHTIVNFQQQLQARDVTLVVIAVSAVTTGGSHEE